MKLLTAERNKDGASASMVNFGWAMVAGMGDFQVPSCQGPGVPSQPFLRPFLFGKLRGGDASEQIGAALGLAEVFVRMDKARCFL